jgi:hypothetical protein
MICPCYYGIAPTRVVLVARSRRNPPWANSSRREEQYVVFILEKAAGMMPLPSLILDKFFHRSKTVDLPCPHTRDT